jgi:RNA polymerase sigma-70 factor, ECF subfamily
MGRHAHPLQDAHPDRVFAEERPRLFGLAYRMLGAVGDAEDVVQEAWLRWQGADREAIANAQAWLTTVVTRLSVDVLRRAQREREGYVGEWLPEPLVLEAALPDRRAEREEWLSMAFLVLLERLSPNERAAYLLREVFGLDYGEIGAILEKSEAACRQLAKRARDHLELQQRAPTTIPDDGAELVARFVQATLDADVEALVACLADDAALHTDHGGKAAAARRTIFGAGKIARFFVGVTQRFAPSDAATRVANINGQPGVIVYSNGRPETAIVLETESGKLVRIYAIRNPDKLRALPALLPAGAAGAVGSSIR